MNGWTNTNQQLGVTCKHGSGGNLYSGRPLKLLWKRWTKVFDCRPADIADFLCDMRRRSRAMGIRAGTPQFKLRLLASGSADDMLASGSADDIVTEAPTYIIPHCVLGRKMLSGPSPSLLRVIALGRKRRHCATLRQKKHHHHKMPLLL